MTDRDRQIFDAGFRTAVRYGDNAFHFHGEQADRVFAKAMESIDAEPGEVGLVDGRPCYITNAAEDDEPDSWLITCKPFGQGGDFLRNDGKWVRDMEGGESLYVHSTFASAAKFLSEQKGGGGGE